MLQEMPVMSGGGGDITLYSHAVSNASASSNSTVTIPNVIGNVKFLELEYIAGGYRTRVIGCIDMDKVLLQQDSSIATYTFYSIAPLTQNGTSISIGVGTPNPSSIVGYYWSDAES